MIIILTFHPSPVDHDLLGQALNDLVVHPNLDILEIPQNIPHHLEAEVVFGTAYLQTFRVMFSPLHRFPVILLGDHGNRLTEIALLRRVFVPLILVAHIHDFPLQVGAMHWSLGHIEVFDARQDDVRHAGNIPVMADVLQLVHLHLNGLDKIGHVDRVFACRVQEKIEVELLVVVVMGRSGVMIDRATFLIHFHHLFVLFDEQLFEFVVLLYQLHNISWSRVGLGGVCRRDRTCPLVPIQVLSA
jgi:hypothetical protein